MSNEWYTLKYKPTHPSAFSRPRVRGAHFVPEQVDSFSRFKYLGSNTWLRTQCLSRPLRRYCHLPTERSFQEFGSEDLFNRCFKGSELETLDEVKKIAFDVNDNRLLQLVSDRIVALENSIVEVNKFLADPVKCDLKNQFECLCKLASDEDWCWNLQCTTCGHQIFRYAFRLMSRGIKIQDEARMTLGNVYRASGWIVRVENNNGDYEGQLCKIPSFAQGWPESVKDTIANICAEADLEVIANNCKYPDWRGYLGLIAAHMSSDSDAYKNLSINWAKQLLEMGEGEASEFDLQEVANGERTLSWRDV